MALKRIDIVYMPETGKPDDRVLIGMGEELVAKRNLLHVEAADDDYALMYKTWLAAKREGKAEGPFDAWVATVAEFRPVLTADQIDELYATGGIEKDIAERAKAYYVRESGESPTPPTP